MKIDPQPVKQSSLQVDIVFSLEEIDQAKTKALKKLGQEATIRGFRKGKAPLNLLEQNLDPDKVKHETLHQILDGIIPKIISDQKLTLSGNPQLIKIDDPSGQPWNLSLVFPLLPVVILGNYQKLIKEAIEKDKKDFTKLDQNQKTDFILNILSQNINFDVPQTLIDQEIDRSLSRLLEQTQTLGLTIEKYLSSINKTVDQIKQEYQNAAINNLKAEFVLLAVADNLKLKITPEDIDKFITAIGDENLKNKLKSESERPFLESLLLKRAAIDALLKI